MKNEETKIIETEEGIIEYSVSNQPSSPKEIENFYKFIANLILKNEGKKAKTAC